MDSVKCNIWNFHLWHFSIRKIEKQLIPCLSVQMESCLSSIIRWFLLNLTFGIFICDIFRYAKSKNGSNVVIYVFIHVYLFKWNPIAIFALHRSCLSSIIRWFLLNVTFGIFICDIFRYVKSRKCSNVVIYVFIPCLSVQMESYCHLCIA